MNTKRGTKKGTKGGNQGAKGKGPVVRKRVAKAAPAPEPIIDEEAPVEVNEAAIPVTDAVEAPVGDVAPGAEAPAETGPRTRRWRDMTIEEMQAEYLAVVGRPTTSRHKGYIAWKCSQARKGRVTVGAIERQPRRNKADLQVLPLTLTRETTRLLDAAVKVAGAKSRSAFIRTALIDSLRAIGGDEALAAADALAGEAG